MAKEGEGAGPVESEGRAETGIDLGSVLAGFELEVPVVAAAVPAPPGETIDLAGLWSEMLFSGEATLDALLGPAMIQPAVPAVAAETPLVAVWTFDPLPEPPVDY